jgi:hypothetical protein
MKLKTNLLSVATAIALMVVASSCAPPRKSKEVDSSQSPQEAAEPTQEIHSFSAESTSGGYIQLKWIVKESLKAKYTVQACRKTAAEVCVTYVVIDCTQDTTNCVPRLGESIAPISFYDLRNTSDGTTRNYEFKEYSISSGIIESYFFQIQANEGPYFTKVE